MTNLDQLLAELEELSPDELEAVYQQIVRLRQPSYWLIPGEKLQTLQGILRDVHQQAQDMTDAEIDDTLDQALDEVRRERKTHRGL